MTADSRTDVEVGIAPDIVTVLICLIEKVFSLWDWDMVIELCAKVVMCER